MGKLVAIGECLIDFLPLGNNRFEAKAGGAPANVCACVAKLGGNACYLGKMSDDYFGTFLFDTLRKCGVETNCIVKTDEYKTALAFVTWDENGDRDFSFYRNPSADMMLQPEEIPEGLFEKGDVLHFCSVGLVESPLKRAHMRAVELARKKGAAVSFDVNVRLPLWKSAEDCKAAVAEFLPYADILKVSEEELDFITAKGFAREGADCLFKTAESASVLFVTKGGGGADVYLRNGGFFTVRAADVKVEDTTGAGDCFIGSVLFKLMKKNITQDPNALKDAAEFASAACGIVVGRTGAIPSMPTLEEVEEALKNYKNKNQENFNYRKEASD